MKREVPTSEKTLSTITLLLFSIVLLFNASRSFPNNIFYFTSIFIIFISFLSFVFIQTVFAKKPSSSLPFLSFNAILITVVLLRQHISAIIFSILLISTIGGLIVTSLKIYTKIKKIHHIKTYNKSEEINKELDDDWNEEPHVIFEKE